jgi:hypothetical protein
MVRSVGPRLLDALEDGVCHHSCIRFGGCGRCGPEDAINAPLALKGCFRLCASVVLLLGARLLLLRGRSEGTTQALHNAAWGVLLLAGGSGGGANNKDNTHVWRVATALLMLLPLLIGGGL